MEHYKNLSLKNIKGETWEGIPSYEDQYLSSSFGRIKGLSRTIIGYQGAKQKLKERILSQGINGTGYCATRRTFVFNGKKTNLVHRLVAKSFLKNPDNKPEVNHISGVKTDNRVQNLEWCSRLENIRHAVSVLCVNSGTKHFRSKFSEKDVIDIFNSTGTHREIALKYNVSHAVVGFIKRKQAYKNILSKLK